MHVIHIAALVVLGGIGALSGAYGDHNKSEIIDEQDGGIKVVGKSLNPPKQHTVNHGQTWLVITETGKHTAVDDAGRTWTFDKFWKMDYISAEKSTARTKHGFDRNHAMFTSYLQNQQSLAKQRLDTVCQECSDEPFDKISNVFTHQFTERLAKLADPKTQKLMSYEAFRAAKWLESHPS